MPIIIDLPPWMKHSACTRIDDRSIFFEENRPTSVRAARAVCNTCPVMVECLEHAFENHEIGIWGGLTTNQRAKLKRKPRLPAQYDKNLAKMNELGEEM